MHEVPVAFCHPDASLLMDFHDICTEQLGGKSVQVVTVLSIQIDPFASELKLFWCNISQCSVRNWSSKSPFVLVFMIASQAPISAHKIVRKLLLSKWQYGRKLLLSKWQ